MSKKNKFVAALPAFVIGSWLLVFRLYLVYAMSDYPWRWILFIFTPFLVGWMTAFFSNLILPLTTSYKKAFKLALPSLIVCLLFFIINDIVVMMIDDDFSLETIGFSIISILLFVFPAGILMMLSTAFFGWLGARIRLGGNKEPSVE